MQVGRELQIRKGIKSDQFVKSLAKDIHGRAF